MTEKTQKILETFLREPKFSKRNEISALAAALRELLSVFDDWSGDEYSNEVFREIREIANELEEQ